MVPISPRLVTMLLMAYNLVMCTLTFNDIETDEMVAKLGIKPSGHEKWVQVDYYLSKCSTLITLFAVNLAMFPLIFARRLFASYLLPLIAWNIFELAQYIIHILIIWLTAPETYHFAACIVSIVFHAALIIQTILYHEILNQHVE